MNQPPQQSAQTATPKTDAFECTPAQARQMLAESRTEWMVVVPATVSRDLERANARLAADCERMRGALERIEKLDPKPIDDPFPADWREQIAACPDCQRYKNHPIQNGICDKHRQPLWERERREKYAEEALPSAMRDIARAALRDAEAKGKEQP